MESDTDANVIEQLRQRYRKEAQIAIEEARSKAIKDVTESFSFKIKSLEDEVRQWKAVAEALSSEEGGTETPQTPLIKYIMENVYRDMKREYSDGSPASQQATATMKRALVSTTEKMLQRLPSLVIRLENPAGNCLPKRQVDGRVGSGGYSLGRPRCLQISNIHALPRMVSLVNVSVDEQTGSGVFSKGYISYLITVHALPRPQTSPRLSLKPSRTGSTTSNEGADPEAAAAIALQFSQRRRYSDFVTFHAELEKRFPLCIVPPLPPKSPGATVAEKRTGETIPEMRQRALRLWLQHILLHGTFYKFPATREFVTGIPTAKAKSSREELGGWEVDGEEPSGWTSTSSKKGSESVECMSDEYEEGEVYDSFLESEGVTRGRSASTGGNTETRYTVSEAMKYKCQQDRHSVTRDYEQLKPNVRSAIDACKILLETMRASAMIRTKLATAFANLADQEETDVEKSALQDVRMGMERTLPLAQSVVTALNECVLEPMVFLNIEVMGVAGSVLSDVAKLPTKEPKQFLEGNRTLLREWSCFRTIRHDTLLRSFTAAAANMAEEHGRIARHWAISTGEIEQLDVSCMTLSGTISRGWRALVARERQELNDTVRALNESHDQRKHMQQLFAESSVFLQNDRRTAATAPRPTAALFANTSTHTTTEPSLRHKVASRPVIPHGSRRDPGERVFYGDAIVDAVEPSHDSAADENAEGGHQTDIDPDEGFEDINFRDTEYLDSRLSNSANEHTATATGTPSKAPSSTSSRTPKKVVAEDAASGTSPEKKSSSKKSSGWGSYFFGKSSSSSKAGKEEGNASSATSPSPTPAPVPKPVPVTKPVAIPSTKPTPGTSGGGTGERQSEDDDMLEDTPMNRAYRERIEKERKLLEEEEERMLHRAGGGGSTGDDVLDEWLSGGGDKRSGPRRRPAPTGTSQRRPKVQTRPHVPGSAPSVDGTNESSSFGSNPYSGTPPATSFMPTGKAQTSASVHSQSALKSASSAGPMSSSYQDHSALFQAAAAQSAARNKQTETSRQSESSASFTPSAPVSSNPPATSANVATNTANASRSSGSNISSEPVDGHSKSHIRPSTSSVTTDIRTGTGSASNPPPSAASVSRESLDDQDPLPEGWEEVSTEEGGRYFYHKVTRISRWERPTAEVAAAVENRVHSSQSKVSESLERKKKEREQQREKEEQEAAVADQLQGKIRQTMLDWRTPPGAAKERSLPELLSLVHVLLGPDLCPPTAIVSAPLTISASPAEVKKAFFKAVRIVHPDKIAATVELEKRMLAEAAFICLSQLYEQYRKAHNI